MATSKPISCGKQTFNYLFKIFLQWWTLTINLGCSPFNKEYLHTMFVYQKKSTVLKSFKNSKSEPLQLKIAIPQYKNFNNLLK